MKEHFHIECQPGVQIYPGLFLGGIPAQIYLLLHWYLPQQRSKSGVSQAVVCRHSTCWLVDPCRSMSPGALPRDTKGHRVQRNPVDRPTSLWSEPWSGSHPRHRMFTSPKIWRKILKAPEWTWRILDNPQKNKVNYSYRFWCSPSFRLKNHQVLPSQKSHLPTAYLCNVNAHTGPWSAMVFAGFVEKWATPK